jgi:uncharacterized protein with PIN domain
MTIYHKVESRVAECHECGESVLCEIVRADHPEAETGYVDEYAICEHCKNGGPRNEPRG